MHYYMKIIFDKTENNYQYPLTHKDVKRLIKLTPEKWKMGIKLVHFLGQEPNKTKFDRPVHFVFLSGKLNLSVIGLTEKQIIKEILIELEQRSNHRSQYRNTLTEEQLKQSLEKIKPYFNEYFQLKENEKNSA